MDPRRIAELLDPFLQEAGPATPTRVAAVLTEAQLNQISIYIDLLIRWNARINLTAIRTPEEIVTRHFGESLFAARHLLGPAHQLPATPGLADLGSGAGFPGVPMKLWSPETPVTLIESNQKKVTFLREVIRALTLTDINVYSRRAETLPSAAASLVTLRAVESFETILPTAARLLVPGGTLALLIGQSQIPQAHSLLPDMSWSVPLPIPHSNSRVLLVGKKPPQGRKGEPAPEPSK
jgi:16S rRNA (guanine527-N7)-methyltransferase